MEPRAYLCAYLEARYLSEHAELTPAARELVHCDVRTRPEKYAQTDHAQALLAYTRAHEQLMVALASFDDLSDEEFERRRAQLFGEARGTFGRIAHEDQLCVDARLMTILLTDVPIDAALGDLLKLENEIRAHLTSGVAGFDLEAPHYWRADELSARDLSAAERTVREPEVVGWLHVLEALANLCLASARYRPAISYARMVRAAVGYPNHAEGTVFLALARLEDEEGFFSFAHELESESHTEDGTGSDAVAAAGAEISADLPGGAPLAVDDSPWYLLGRTLLLYKLGKRKPAQRSLRDFAARCEGGAFFLLNPTYLDPYLPVRPAPREAWDLTHQAVWEADGIIADTPDFVGWAEGVNGIFDSSEGFAARNGF